MSHFVAAAFTRAEGRTAFERTPLALRLPAEPAGGLGNLAGRSVDSPDGGQV